MINSQETDNVMDYEQQLKSIKENIESNEQGICLIAQSVIDLSNEIRDSKKNYSKETAIGMISGQLEEYIQVKCSSCSIRERLGKIEQEGE